MLDFRMDPQEAIDSPRCFHVGGVLEAERGVSDIAASGLAALGHRVVRPDMPWGGGQAIAIDHANGTLAAASDPRRDGCALAY
jgi:gamma-glutamyltranspeptidase/glutathione hydrolase